MHVFSVHNNTIVYLVSSMHSFVTLVLNKVTSLVMNPDVPLLVSISTLRYSIHDLFTIKVSNVMKTNPTLCMIKNTIYVYCFIYRIYAQYSWCMLIWHFCLKKRILILVVCDIISLISRCQVTPVSCYLPTDKFILCLL